MHIPACSSQVLVVPDAEETAKQDCFTSAHNCLRSNLYDQFLFYIIPSSSVSLTKPCLIHRVNFFWPQGLALDFYIQFIVVKEV